MRQGRRWRGGHGIATGSVHRSFCTALDFFEYSAGLTEGLPMLIRRGLFRFFGLVSTITIAAALVSCSFLPNRPLDQPLSMAVEDGDLLFSWRGGAAQVQRVQVAL